MKKILIILLIGLPLITQAIQLRVTFYNDSEPGGVVPLTIHVPEQTSISCLDKYGPAIDKVLQVHFLTTINLEPSNSLYFFGSCLNYPKRITWNISAPNVYQDEYKISSNITLTLKRIDDFWNTEVSIHDVNYFRNVKVHMISATCTYSTAPNKHYDCSSLKGGVSYSYFPDENIDIHLERTFDIPKK